MKLVSVEWLDIRKTMNEDEFNEKWNIDELLTPMKSSGWLYKQTTKTVLLVQEFEDGKVRDWMVIPKALITKMEEIDG